MKILFSTKQSLMLNLVLVVLLFITLIVACNQTKPTDESGKKNAKDTIETYVNLPFTNNVDSGLSKKGIFRKSSNFPWDIATLFIKAYKEEPNRLKEESFFIDASTIKYYDSVLKASGGNMDGVRVYLAKYTVQIGSASGSFVYPKGTISAILVATQSVDSIAPNGTHIQYHEDWFKGNKKGIHIRRPIGKTTADDPEVNDYNDPCPPGRNCFLGNDLSNN